MTFPNAIKMTVSLTRPKFYFIYFVSSQKFTLTVHYTRNYTGAGEMCSLLGVVVANVQMVIIHCCKGCCSTASGAIIAYA